MIVRPFKPIHVADGVLIASMCICLSAGCRMGLTGEGGRWGKTERSAGEQWTILCVEGYGQEGLRAVERLADGLRRTRGLERKSVRIDSQGETHRLFYGGYRREQEEKTGTWHWPEAMRRDMAFIRQLAVADQFPFLHARPELVGGSSAGPPEWDLSRADGDYTVLIAVYADFQGRDEAAVEHVRLLRDQGEPAYYYHDLTRSHVCVGLFDDRQMKRDENGVLVIDDPEYLAVRRRHPYFSFNGRYISNVNRDEAGRIVSKDRQQTRLVRIPERPGQKLDAGP